MYRGVGLRERSVVIYVCMYVCTGVCVCVSLSTATHFRRIMTWYINNFHIYIS